MQEGIANSQVIIVSTEHPVLGILLIPYIAEIGVNGNIELIEQAFHASEERISQMSEAEQKVIEIASHYTEKYLMEVYSKEKVVSRFLRKLSESPERVKANIRPFIEKKITEMLPLIRSGEILFYQKQGRSKILYAHHAYQVYRNDIMTHFTFRLEPKQFSYQLQCSYEGQPLSLTEKKPVAVLVSNPATLLLGMDLLCFHHIESKLIQPFTNKRTVNVDAAESERYIDNILIPIARYHEITTHGIAITEEKRLCEAVLYLEETIYNTELLKINFRYGDTIFTPHTSNEPSKVFYRKNGESIFFYQRNLKAEARAIEQLKLSGLDRVSDVHFKLSPSATEKSLSEWINHHREMLQQNYCLTSDQENLPYCLDEIRIEQSCEDGPDWFDLHITVLIGNLRIPFTRFRKHILEGKREYLLPDGRVILLPDEWFSTYANLLEMGKPSEKGIRIQRTFVGVVNSLLANQMDAVSFQQPALPQAVPNGLKAQLRPYQQKGFDWLVRLYEQNLGGCLADDMGLGKTLQTLTLLQFIYKGNLPEHTPEAANRNESLSKENLNEKEKKPSKVNEQGQFELFSFHSTDDLLPGYEQTRTEEKPAGQPIVPRKPSTLIVVPTSLLHNWRREVKRFTTLSITEYTSGIHLSKDHPEWYFDRFHLIFTTYGTMRNNIDLLSRYPFEYIILDESQNIKNSESRTFRTAVQLQGHHRLVLTGTPIENSLKDLWAQFCFIQPDLLGDESSFQKQFINPIRQGNQRMEKRLQQLISPFILRRSKSEVAPELPELTEETIYCDMTEEQSNLYQQEKNSLRNLLLQPHKSTEKHQNLTILNGILRLRQLSCHPQLLLPDCKTPSGKLELIIDTFDTLRSEGHKVLIFSSFVKHLEIIAEEFQRRRWKYALLTGSTNNRQSEIAHFTEQPDVQAFLISLKAGGVGLNLTQADYVFIIDPWWNPAAEAQAIARAHRIGQKKQVIAYRFITQDSIEEKILQLQEEKKRLAEIFITDSDSMPHLSEQEWVSLLQ